MSGSQTNGAFGQQSGPHQCKLSILYFCPWDALLEHAAYGQLRLIRMGYVDFDTRTLTGHAR